MMIDHNNEFSHQLSIVIPTRNEILQLPRLLEDIRRAGIPISNVIVADSNSTDGTQEFCKTMGVPLVDGGLPGRGRNRGAEIVTTEWIAFFDADIRLRPEFFSSVSKIVSSGQFDALSFGWDTDSKNILVKLFNVLCEVYFYLTQYSRNPHGIGGAIIVKRSAHFGINGFNEDITVAEDQDYLRRISKRYRFRFTLQPKVTISMRRINDEGLWSNIVKWIRIEFRRLVKGEIRDDSIRYFQ